MKKHLCLFLGVLFAAMVPGIVFAHPPSDIKIKYDPAGKMLEALIEHAVSNPQGHYIKKVDVSLNGKEILSQELSRQDNNQTQTVKYLIPDAKAGDTLAVEAYCSISGKLEKEIKTAQ